MHKLIEIDRQAFEFVNNNLHNNFLDWFMPFMRNQSSWSPLYIFMLVLVVTNYKKNGWYWFLATAITIYLSNYISSTLIKENIARLRPCNDPELANTINFLIGYKPQSSSFTSSHATNHFAMAAFFYFTLRKQMGKIMGLFFVWAAIICFAQVYVGVHFPLDVVCGAIIGFLFGYLCATSFNKRLLLT